MRQARFASTIWSSVQVRSIGGKATLHDDILPTAQYNPFQGGLKFPSTGRRGLDPLPSGEVKRVFGNPKAKWTRDSSTGQVLSRNVPKKENLSLKFLAERSVVDRPDAVEELMRHDDVAGRKEREACARMAVRKLMSLHFHSKKTSKVEASLVKEESMTVTSRYLDERQKVKEANATASILSGSTPMPTSQGVIGARLQYQSGVAARIRSMDKRSAAISARLDRSVPGSGLRTKGAFVATEANTAGLLQEKHQEVDEPDWSGVGSAGGRTLDQILEEGGRRRGEGSSPSDVVEDTDDWADAHDSTFSSIGEVKPHLNQHADFEDSEATDERLSERKAPESRSKLFVGGKMPKRRDAQKRKKR